MAWKNFHCVKNNGGNSTVEVLIIECFPQQSPRVVKSKKHGYMRSNKSMDEKKIEVISWSIPRKDMRVTFCCSFYMLHWRFTINNHRPGNILASVFHQREMYSVVWCCTRGAISQWTKEKRQNIQIDQHHEKTKWLFGGFTCFIADIPTIITAGNILASLFHQREMHSVVWCTREEEDQRRIVQVKIIKGEIITLTSIKLTLQMNSCGG